MEMMADPVLRDRPALTVMGTVRLIRPDGIEIKLSRKARALIAYLAFQKGFSSREHLAMQLWCDRSEPQARGSLRQALYELRTLVDGGGVIVERDRLAVAKGGLETDFDRCEVLIGRASWGELATMMESWRSPLFDGLDGISDEYDDWLRDERRGIPGRVIAAVLPILDRATRDDARAAARIATVLQRIEPLDEAVVRAGVAADLACGDRTGALRRGQEMRERLERELGIEPSPETARALALVRAAGPTAGRSSENLPPLQLARSQVRSGKALVALLIIVLFVGGSLWLWTSRSRVSPTGAVLAVLPFEPLTPGEGYFAKGMAEEVLNAVASRSQIKVLGRVSAETLDRQTDPLAAARGLGVTMVLDGSVRTDRTRILVIARLVRTSDATQIWSQRFERARGDAFSVQREIASAVSARLARPLVPRAAAGNNALAFQRYLAARALARERRPVTLDQADTLLREAIKLDSNYAAAYAELAQVMMLRADHPTSYGTLPYNAARREAEQLARRAVALDPNLGDAYAALGFVNFSEPSSVGYYAKAVAASPQRADFYRWYGQSLVANYRFDEALRAFRTAVSIDPLWGLNYEHLIALLGSLGRRDEQYVIARRLSDISTDQRALLMVRRAIAGNEGRLADANRLTAELYRRFPRERQMTFQYASTLASLGETKQAASILRDDAVGTAVLSRDWATLAKLVKAQGGDFFDLSNGLWNTARHLLASGQGDIIVAAYDRTMASKDTLFDKRERTAGIYTILALQRAGRTRDADVLASHLQWQVDHLPRIGLLAVRRSFKQLELAVSRGDRDGARAALLDLSKAKLGTLIAIPNETLRTDPALALLRDDPLVGTLDKRLFDFVNAQRRAAALAPLTEARWAAPAHF